MLAARWSALLDRTEPQVMVQILLFVNQHILVIHISLRRPPYHRRWGVGRGQSSATPQPSHRRDLGSKMVAGKVSRIEYHSSPPDIFFKLQ